MKHSSHPQEAPHGKRGGVLLTAIMFAAVGALTIGSFIKLTSHELRLSNIQFYSNESLNLAEAGLEEGLYALNSLDWREWTVDGQTATLSVTGIPVGAAVTAEFSARVENRLGEPTITAEGRINTRSALSSTKQVRITLRKRTYFANGITARESIVFSGGNAYVDSYLSSLGPYSDLLRRDRGTVASVSVTADAITLGNGHVWGYVFTGGSDPDVRQGTILGENSPAGATVDSNRIARDFSAEFPLPLDPPRGVAVAHYPTIGSGLTLGTPGATDPTVITVGSIKMSEDLNIIGPVIMIVDGNISFSGSGGLNVGFSQLNAENASLRVYAYGDFSISGKGMGNLTRMPENLAIFGMNTIDQSFSLGGNARWEAAVYAPNGDLKLNGGGNDGHMSGAVVGRNVVINGGSKFHYDEDLIDFTDAFGFAMDTWEELLGANRIEFH